MVTQGIRIHRSIHVSDPSCPPLQSAMTVEHLPSTEHGTQTRENVLNQLKEITGVEDVHILKQALEASRNESGTYDITQAVTFLVEENAVRYNQQPQQSTKSVVPVASAGKPQDEDVKVIDLTSEGSEKDEIQKAIALSLQEQQHGMLGGQVTVEEQDISLVLEQSLAESKVGAKRKRGEVRQDSLNPHERKRLGNWPVGLKNVGNTCWFSAVIQSLFHLPIFRHLVLTFSSPEDWDRDLVAPDSSEKRNYVFMKELRNLFALLVGSQRKYVDPSKAVDILKEAFQGGSTDSQQDVSEFTHKLLEWLEDAFKSDCSRPSSPLLSNENGKSNKKHNPMIDLFYGQFRCDGLNDGHVFSKEEKFGQYPLQVNGFGNIHESLEAATAQEIESDNSDVMTKSGQEHWFTQLPPALLFELSRFKFNQHLGRPEKIHNRFDFPEVIYMDRYMEVNKNFTKIKREEIKKLKERRECLQSRLDRFLNYGSGRKRFPLQDVLQCTLEFVESTQDASKPPSLDVEMSSPASSSSSTVPSNEACNCVAQSATPVKNENLPADKAVHGLGNYPSPGHVSETELQVLQNCLHRWRTEVEHDVKVLQDSIAKIDSAIHNMYNVTSLKKVCYRLHAVLVHEGQAASGHYWAYVYDHCRKRWLKFNDITVTDASLEDLQKESFGGYHNASAYCLMYIDSNKKDLVRDCVYSDAHKHSCSVDHLPEELKELIVKDNERFKMEIDAWDVEQRQLQLKATTDSNKMSCEIDHSFVQKEEVVADKVLPSKTMESWSPEPEVSKSPPVYQKSSFSVVEQVAEILRTKGPEEALSEAIDLELMRYQKLSNITDPLTDTRLQHIAVYLLANDVPTDPLVVWAVLEQLSHSSLDADDRGRLIRQVAEQRLLKHVKRTLPIHRKLYAQWQEDFKSFCDLAATFTAGLEALHDKRYPDALTYLVNACALNDSILNRSATGKRRGFDSKLLAYYQRWCLLKLNSLASTLFEVEDVDVAKDALQLMTEYVVPCMNLLTAVESSEDDNAAAEEIRSTWCSKLGDDITSQKRDYLPEFLSKLLDPSSEFKLRDSPPLISAQDLSERFTAAISLAQSNGTLKAAYES